IGVVAAVVAVGAVAIRGSDLDAFARFLGASPGKVQAPETKVQTYSHRTLLAWLGWEIWKDDPLLGVGWEGSAEPANFVPHLPAAHRRFPDEAPLAFPSAAPDRRYGVQNSWLQALADLGVVGFSLWAGVFAAGAWQAAPRVAGRPGRPRSARPRRRLRRPSVREPARRRDGDRRLRRARQSACGPARLDRRDPGRRRELRGRALPPGARARTGSGGG